MDFSFCITSSCDEVAQNRLEGIIHSIKALNIPNYEILLIGENSNYINNNIQYIYFNESDKQNWITKKKNILSIKAKYPILVMMHDYFLFDPEWYKGYLHFGDDWDVCSNPQLLQDGRRHWLDWTVWDDPLYSRYTGLCYSDYSRTQHMYISGAYYLVKKTVALNYPLNEELMWGQAEDIEWSLRIRNNHIFKCNKYSIVQHNKSHRDLVHYNFQLNEC